MKMETYNPDLTLRKSTDHYRGLLTLVTIVQVFTVHSFSTRLVHTPQTRLTQPARVLKGTVALKVVPGDLTLTAIEAGLVL